MFRKLLVLAIAALVLVVLPTSSLNAQGGTSSAREAAGPNAGLPIDVLASTECSAGIIYDDGTPENARGWEGGDEAGVWYGQRFISPTYPYVYDQVCLLWTRTGTDTSITYNIEIYENDGPDGSPNTYLGSWGPFTIEDVPEWPNASWYAAPIYFDTTGSDFVYVMVSWEPATDNSFFVVTDENGGGMRQPSYYWWAHSSGWHPMTETAPDYNAFYMRVDGTPDTLAAGWHEDTAEFLHYNEQWKPATKGAASGGTAIKAKSGASMSFNFFGDMVVIYRRIGPNEGAMEVCIDGTCLLISNYNATIEWTVPVTFGPFSPPIMPVGGDPFNPEYTHSVTINRPATEAAFWLDAVEVVDLTSEVPALSSGALYNENAANFLYYSNWGVKTKAAAINGQVFKAKDLYSSVYFHFTGDEFTYYSRYSPTEGLHRLTIDGNVYTVDLTNATKTWGYGAYVHVAVGPGTHYVGLQRMPGNKFFFDGVWVGAGAPVAAMAAGIELNALTGQQTFIPPAAPIQPSDPQPDAGSQREQDAAAPDVAPPPRQADGPSVQVGANRD